MMTPPSNSIHEISKEPQIKKEGGGINCGFVIPNYNHHDVIVNTIESLLDFQLPIILVDDGSQQKTQEVLDDLDKQYAHVTLIRRDKNGGKGAAVKTGLKAAIAKGWTHALQVDADGQHDLGDVQKLLSLAESNPEYLISGLPSYDDSISSGRYYGRFITHFWVYVETLSFEIKDSMCGFRVYPLRSYKKLISESSLGDKMDFDIEVMVKMYWIGVRLKFMPTKVLYPEGGLSHFNLLQDNILISLMHTKLFFGMLWRIPKLLFWKFNRTNHIDRSSTTIESETK